MRLNWDGQIIDGHHFKLAAAGNLAAAESQDIEKQRAAFRAVYPEAERGNWQPVLQYEQLLKSYVLWPDLRAIYFRAQLKYADHAEVGAFLAQYGTLKPARELRYQFSLHLGDSGHFAEYMELYRQYYQDLNIARLDCLALQAEIRDGRDDRIENRGLVLWLVGKSQADECDPVFAHLRAANALTDEHYRRRFALAVQERNFSLARYLSKPLTNGYLEEANAWFEARNDPEDFLRTHADRVDDNVGRRQLIYALERLAFDDPLLASESA